MLKRDPDAQAGNLLKLETHSVHGDLTELLEVRTRIDALGMALGGGGRHSDQPRADVLDVGHAWQVRLEVPGAELADLEIALRGQTLIVAGVRSTLEEGVRVLIRERPVGAFQRELLMPGEIDAEGVSAHLRSGLLVIDLQKLA